MSTLPKLKKVMPTRPRRDPAEDGSGPFYVKHLLENGPRKGERITTWLRRLTGIQSARRFWVRLWQQFEGDRQAIQMAVGMGNAATSNELSAVGLDHQTCFFMAFTQRPNDLDLDILAEVMNHVKIPPSIGASND